MKSISYNDLKKQHQFVDENTRIIVGGCDCDCYAPCTYDYQEPPIDCSRIKEIYGDNEFNSILNLATSAANSKYDPIR